MSSEIRQDYFLKKYVIITPQRAARPQKTEKSQEFSQKKQEDCPFCPNGIEKELILKVYPSLSKKYPWSAMAIKNKYPIVSLDSPQAYGQHEVIIESPEHDKQLSELSLKQITNLLNVFKHRTEILSRISKIDYILIFKNEGGKAGASLPHSHCQVFASEILPPDLKEEFMAMKKYQGEYQRCPYCDIIKKEEKSPRLVWANEDVVAFCPAASAYHYETWIFPRRHLDNINDLTQKETISFARVLKKILEKIEQMGLAYNFFLHQVISERNQHFYLKIQPRQSVWGGLELGSGIIVNSLSPEKAAQYLRK
jgi:UDPglucose--hexose-1-phosphate uridylyltransferase